MWTDPGSGYDRTGAPGLPSLGSARVVAQAHRTGHREPAVEQQPVEVVHGLVGGQSRAGRSSGIIQAGPASGDFVARYGEPGDAGRRGVPDPQSL
ncbi:hypothetical protein ACH4Q9_19910 [Streptomyces sp. NPDC021086]|uniref:hypothetical protein n=1 Tax=Streptomyces sp. NPDC021086 TaxID=3365111 RepID=UPI0037A07FA2